MDPVKCEDVEQFVQQMDNLINSHEEVEWEGRTVSFGTEKNLQNIQKFLNENSIYWKDTSNPEIGNMLAQLSARIKREDNSPMAQELAAVYEKEAETAKFPPEVVANILGFAAESKKWGREVMQELHSPKQVSKQWRALTAEAKIEWFNHHSSSWDEVFKGPQEVVNFAVKSGSKLKTFNGVTFYDRFRWADPFNHEDYLRVIRACPNLSNVIVAGRGVTNDTAKEICQTCKKLTTLEFQDTDITAVPQPLPDHITQLSFFSCPSLASFPAKLPADLETLKIHGSPAKITALPPKLKTLEIYMGTGLELPKVLPESLTKIQITLSPYDNPDQREAIKQQLKEYQEKHPQCQIEVY